jgi:xanthine dehydrogenase YagS FAD-binding subunit
VAPTPYEAAAAEKALVGKPITAATAEAAGKAAVAAAKPLSQNAYKVSLAKVAVKRALLAAAGVKA